MGTGWRTQARRVLLQQVAPASHQASASQKREILEAFVTATGYAHTYARWLLHHVEEVFAPPAALRRQYGAEVEEALVLAWKTPNRIWRNHSHWPDPLEERSSQDGPAPCHYLSQICTSDFLTRERSASDN